MIRKSYYSSVSRTKRNKSKIAAIILACLLVLLIGFIVWAVVVFQHGGSGAFENQTKQISELKIQLHEKDAQIADLTAQIETMKQAQANAAAETAEPNTTQPPQATATPSVTPRRTATSTPNSTAPARTSTPQRTQQPTTPPPATPSLTPTPPPTQMPAQTPPVQGASGEAAGIEDAGR